MAKKRPAKPAKSEVTSIIEDYQNDLGAMALTHESFEDKERVLMSQPIDQITETETRSRVSDPTLLSAVLKQNNHEMAQMPSGKVTALTQQNRGKSLFMDLILHKHIIPHANTQFDAYTKLWLMSLMRKVYGSFGVLVDFVDKTNGGKNPSGYIGPDFSLIPARGIIPQSGKTTIEDSDYAWIRSRVSRSFLESRDTEIWTGIDKILETDGDKTVDLNSQSYVERQFDGAVVTKDEFEIITRYEGDRWRTFHPATQTEIRDLSQNSSQIPIVMCHSYPLMDRFFGLGDFERGMTLHASISSLINLYLDGVKMSIFPPLKIDPMYIDNWDDFKDGIGPAQIWLMQKEHFSAIDQMNISPSGLQSFQHTYQFLKATILTVTGTTDTNVSASVDPGFGKTPQALKMQAFSQGMQAQFGRRMLELSVEKIFDRMIDLTAKKQESPMNMYVGERELQQVKEIAPDVVEMFEVGNMGKVTIKPEDVNEVEYRYEIDQGSTIKTDEAQENASLTEILGFVSKIPGSMEALAQGGTVPLGGGKRIDIGEAVKRWIITTGITDWDKIVIEDEKGKNVLNTEDPQVQEALQKLLQETQAQQNMPPQPPQGQVDPSMLQPQPQAQPPMMGGEAVPTGGDQVDPRIMQVMQELSQMAGSV